MSKCKRYGCVNEAEVRPRYNGYCSLQCQDYDDYEQEIAYLKAKFAELKSESISRGDKLVKAVFDISDLKAKNKRLVENNNSLLKIIKRDIKTHCNECGLLVNGDDLTYDCENCNSDNRKVVYLVDADDIEKAIAENEEVL